MLIYVSLKYKSPTIIFMVPHVYKLYISSNFYVKTKHCLLSNIVFFLPFLFTCNTFFLSEQRNTFSISQIGNCTLPTAVNLNLTMTTIWLIVWQHLVHINSNGLRCIQSWLGFKLFLFLLCSLLFFNFFFFGRGGWDE